MRVVIIGGSVAGLIHAVMLKHHGHEVHVLERVTRDLEAQGAGISTSNEVRTFLDLHDRIKTPFSLVSHGVKVYDPTTTLQNQIMLPMEMSTWDAMYYRLRANFDGLVTKYHPNPPADLPTDGRAIYDMGKEFTGVERRGSGYAVSYIDRATGQTMEPLQADLVIGADGATSSVRRLLAPNAPPRQYAGYVAWRGIVPESSVSASARELMSNCFTFHTGGNEYIVVYHVPGVGGSLKEGERGLNFVWYSWQTEEALRDVLTDTEGHTHRWSVPAGKLRPEVWARQRIIGMTNFDKELGEVIEKTKTENAFVQSISDCASPSSPGPSFFDGRVLLVGDAQCILRPHIGWALNQASKHCMELEKRLPELEKLVAAAAAAADEAAGLQDRQALQGRQAIQDWDQDVLDYGHVHRLRSIAFGMPYLKPFRYGWLPSMMRWKLAEWVVSLKRKWRGFVYGRV